MGEYKGFGKSGRNEGYKPAARSGRTTDAKSSRTTDTRGGRTADARGGRTADARGSNYGAATGKDHGAARGWKGGSSADFRGSRPKDAPGESRPADFRGDRPKYTPGDGKPVDFRGSRPKYTPGDGKQADFRGGRPKYTPSDGRPKYTPSDGRPKYTPSDNRPKYTPSDDRPKYTPSDDRPKYTPGDSRPAEFGGNRNIKQDTGRTEKSYDEPQDKRDFAIEENTEELQGDLDKLEGRNSVLEALKAGRSINKIFVAKGDREGSVNQIIAMARQSHILIQEIDRAKLDAMSLTHSHQGVIALTAAKDYVEVDEILASAAASGRPPFIIILDEITDSHNLGSILRTANAAGVHGIIIPKRRAIGLTSVVSKASAGAIEYVPVARVTNIVQTIESLKKQNIWVVGTDSTGDKSYFDRDLTGPIALVIGSEGEGMGKLVRESCDFVVNIPMLGQISSLNAAVAGAIVTYEILRQRSKKQP